MYPETMKLISFVFLLAAALAACQPTSPSAEEVTAGNPALTGCYTYRQDSNQVLAYLETADDTVTGYLRYDFYEKDDNTGTFAGATLGDTLVGVYTFASEGQESQREVAFLIQGDTLAEGYGPLQEAEGIQRFEDVDQLTFGQGIILTKAECREDSAGCRLDFGERFSYIRQECIQPRQVGTSLYVASQEGGPLAFLLLADDEQQAEVFLPDKEDVLALERIEEEGDHYWLQGAYRLLPEDGCVLQLDKEAIYAGRE